MTVLNIFDTRHPILKFFNKGIKSYIIQLKQCNTWIKKKKKKELNSLQIFKTKSQKLFLIVFVIEL